VSDRRGKLTSMEKAQVTTWIAAYERAWRAPGTERLAELFTADASYSMGPYQEPAVGLPAIATLWEAERKGPDEVFRLTSEVVAVDGDAAVVRAEVRYGEPVRQEYRDLWVLFFAADGRCRSFEEWPFWPDRPPTPARDVALRDVVDDDLPFYFESQLDPEATRMAAVAAREREPFLAHWAKVRADPTVITKTIVAGGQVVGNIGSFGPAGEQEVGYWIGREHWGRGLATSALAAFLGEMTVRPLYAHVVKHNVGSIRVLEKGGFRRDRVQEAKAPAPDDGVEEFIFVLDA
jgi:RimJ/RimL family protein N-acetyltransferase